MTESRVVWFRRPDGSMQKKVIPIKRARMTEPMIIERPPRRTQPREYKGDSFDVFCLRQRARLSHKLQRIITRVKGRVDDVEEFESRK